MFSSLASLPMYNNEGQQVEELESDATTYQKAVMTTVCVFMSLLMNFHLSKLLKYSLMHQSV